MQTIKVLIQNMTLSGHDMEKLIPRWMLYQEKDQDNSADLCKQWVSCGFIKMGKL